MIQTGNRWECGSFFHWAADGSPANALFPWGGAGAFFGSGRDAFRTLLTYGRSARGWKRLWVPSYFCQEVVRSLVSTGISVCLYPDGPEDLVPRFDGVDLRSGDVLLRMNFFGLRDSLNSDTVDHARVEVIDDHSHDPWSDPARHSDADWCIASLRKTLPVPDGGVLWSPRGHQAPAPPAVTQEHETAALHKFAAIVLKSLYLNGYSIEKEVFRSLAADGEGRIASEDVSGMPEWTSSLLRDFPTESWRDQRCRNHRVLSEALADVSWLKVLQPADPTKTCPFAGIVVLDSAEQRDHVRRELIAHQVYPTILWPLDSPAVDGIPLEHVRFSQSMFTIHSDMRYSVQDMERVAGLIREIGARHQISPSFRKGNLQPSMPGR